MIKLDLKKELKHLYHPSAKEVSFVDVPKMNFLMIDGEGDPNGSAVFQEAVDALFSLSYTLKFMVKKGRTAVDYTVMPLEGLWWVDDMNDFDINNKSNWKWTLMIMQPEFVTAEMFREAIVHVEKKKALASLEKARLECFVEGPAAQVMHIGPYSAEGPTVERLHRFIAEQGKTRRGKHHEIYLSDARKAAPEKLKTVIRQPVQ